MNKLLVLIFFTFYFSLFTLKAQDHTVDSLQNVFKASKEDSDRIKILKNIAMEYIFKSIDSAISYSEKAYLLSLKSNDNISKYSASNMLSSQYLNKGTLDKGLEYALISLKYAEESGKRDIIIKANKFISRLYSDNLRNLSKGAEYGQTALKLAKESGDLKTIIQNLENVSTIYFNNARYDSALHYSTEEYNVALRLNNPEVTSDALASLGDCNRALNNYSLAVSDYQQAIEIGRRDSIHINLAVMYNNIALIYKPKEPGKAIDYYLLAINTAKRQKWEGHISFYYEEISMVYFDIKDYKNALKYNQLAIPYQRARGALPQLSLLLLKNAEINNAMKNFETAYKSLNEYDSIRDEIQTDESKNKIASMEVALETVKKQKEIDIINKEKEQQKTIRNYTLGGLFIVVFLLVFVFIQRTRIAREKKLSEQQKALVEAKNKDILDSITYAKRLQDAILPPINLIKNCFPESFVLYKPKDIVAGDFYWMERVGDMILIAAADCTGHGVPGALVSVVCSNALNRAVKEFHITEPGKILDKVRELVLETFEKSESDVQDGMDISLLAISYQPLAISHNMQWSGAYNSLWYIRGKEFNEVNGDKQPIGKHDKPVLFKTHTIDLQKGDTIYLFTDGYADQFGGPKGKKYKYKQLSDKITEISDKRMEEQKEILDKEFENWKGDLEQVDDVLIIGIRV